MRIIALLLGAGGGAVVAAATTTARAETPSVPEGLVLVAKIAGQVSVKVDGTERALRIEDRVPIGAALTCARGSTASLVFSNGSVVELGGDTVLTMENYRQQPFSGTIKGDAIVEEPSVSQTKIRLVRGQVVVATKRLRHDAGSSFTVVTPAGDVKVRASNPAASTSFRLVCEAGSPGRITTHVVVSAGDVVLARGSEPDRVVSAGEEITVPAGASARTTGKAGTPEYP